MLGRALTGRILDALADTPVVLLNGARQTGKSTLVQWLAADRHPARYLTFDDAAILAAARVDPAGFVASLEGPVVLDEVQRAPELFPAIKMAVDRRREPGRFFLTGSANVLLLPRLSESLAGRMEILTLWPFSQGEIEQVQEGFLDAIFARSSPSLTGLGEDRARLLGRVLRGGYPEVLDRPEARRRAWFGAYVTTILQRDVRDLANVEDLAALPRLLALLAARASSLLNFAELSRSAGIPQTTLKRYMSLLQAAFLVHTVPAWSANLGKRLVKTPKVVLNDTGLAAHLVGLTEERLGTDEAFGGRLLENFVVTEIFKQTGWSRTRGQVLHFRTAAGQEVDIVVETDDGRIVGIEVKAASAVETSDFKGIKALQEAAGRRFHRGVVLYTGAEGLPFGPGLYALPLSALWRLGASAGARHR